MRKFKELMRRTEIRCVSVTLRSDFFVYCNRIFHPIFLLVLGSANIIYFRRYIVKIIGT